MNQNKDFRKKFINNILIDDTIKTSIINEYNIENDVTTKITELNNKLDIDRFKLHFNNMILGLGFFEYNVYDMLKFYYKGSSGNGTQTDNNGVYLANFWKQKEVRFSNNSKKNIHQNILSDFIMDLIVDAIEINFASRANRNDSNFKVSYYLDNNLDENYNPYKNLNKNFIESFKEHVTNNRGKSVDNLISTYQAPQQYKNIFIVELDNDLKIFGLYDYIIEVENTIQYTESGLDKSFSKIIYFIQNYLVIYILKYYVLSELLLKLLLDTKNNYSVSDLDSDDKLKFIIGDINISEEDSISSYKKENIIKNNYDNSSINSTILNNDVGLKFFDTNDQANSKADVEIIKTYVYKIIQDMWFINYLMEKNVKFLLLNNVKDINTQEQNPVIKSEADLEKLNNKVENINKNILELNLKNLNLQKNYEKKRNMYYIIITLIILFIFINLYIIKNNKLESLLTINIILVVVILLTKFFTLIKKSYQTLVKDLNN